MSESALGNDKVIADNIIMENSDIEEEDSMHDETQVYNNEENIQDVERRNITEGESWTLVGGEKRRKADKIDICISSKDKLPKQFALAKLFHAENILGINRVKYINAFKVVVSFDDELKAGKLLSCQGFIEKEWRIQNTLEVNISYGIIRDIDIDLSETEILKYIKTDNERKIMAVKRLNRRNSESGWAQSETIRICFKGSDLPQYIKIFDTRIKVEPYVFPVTQCSRCWRFGHTIKLCPSLKIICPKCGKNHANCETTNFKCVNCYGNHMSLVKICPAYTKEKKIRALMSEFNCSYRRALTMYVPPFSPRHEVQYRRLTSTSVPNNMNASTYPQKNRSSAISRTIVSDNSYSYAEATQKHASLNTMNASSERKRTISKRKHRSSSEQLAYEANESSSPESHIAMDERCVRVDMRTSTESSHQRRRGATSTNMDYDANNNSDDASINISQPGGSNKQSNTMFDGSKSFEYLVDKIKQVIFSKRESWSEKIKVIISMAVEWCVVAFVEYFSDLSLFKKMFDITFNSQNK